MEIVKIAKKSYFTTYVSEASYVIYRSVSPISPSFCHSLFEDFFASFCLILPLFTSFWLNLTHFDSFWLILTHLKSFVSFCLILTHFISFYLSFCLDNILLKILVFFFSFVDKGSSLCCKMRLLWVISKHCAVQQVVEIKKFHYFYGQKDDVHAFNVLP